MRHPTAERGISHGESRSCRAGEDGHHLRVKSVISPVASIVTCLTEEGERSRSERSNRRLLWGRMRWALIGSDEGAL